ncbi:MAG: hypothetical protein QXI50_06395, partial [Candidatus Caldarchaeum sp.]
MTALDTVFNPQLRAVLKSRKIATSLIVVLGFVAVGASAPFLPLIDPNKQSLAEAALPPFWVDGGVFKHPLGTD